MVVLVLFSLQATLFPDPALHRPVAALVRRGAGRRAADLGAGQLGHRRDHVVARRRRCWAFSPPGALRASSCRVPALLRGLITLPLTVSYLIIGMGLLVLFNWAGVPKSLLAAGIGHVVINLPLCFAIVYSQMGDASDQHRARGARPRRARMEGAGAGHRADDGAGALCGLLSVDDLLLGRVRDLPSCLPASRRRCRSRSGTCCAPASIRRPTLSVRWSSSSRSCSSCCSSCCCSAGEGHERAAGRCAQRFASVRQLCRAERYRSRGRCAGSYTVLLGPSGSGKTTLLSILGGFLVRRGQSPYPRRGLHGAAAGQTSDDDGVSGLCPIPAHELSAAMSGFGLRMRGVAAAERAERARAALELVGLAGTFDKKPHQLSGGQRQRVALARALVVDPAVLLLDEPLGALDLKLRRQMQDELKAIQKRVGTAFVHVTHDQEEAMALADHCVVMNDGRIEDEGPPERVYSRPATRFSATFMGESTILAGDSDGGQRRG